MTFWAKVEQISLNEEGSLESVSPGCMFGIGRLGSPGDCLDKLVQRDFSVRDGACVTQTSDLQSWVKDAPSLYDSSVMRLKKHPLRCNQQSAMAFVADEPDWPILGSLVRASTEFLGLTELALPTELRQPCRANLRDRY